jgi:hypothetical protein
MARWSHGPHRRPCAPPRAAAGETLLAELQSFTVRISAAGNETFAALRERDHDDLVLATAMAVWFAEKRVKPAQ